MTSHKFSGRFGTEIWVKRVHGLEQSFGTATWLDPRPKQGCVAIVNIIEKGWWWWWWWWWWWFYIGKDIMIIMIYSNDYDCYSLLWLLSLLWILYCWNHRYDCDWWLPFPIFIFHSGNQSIYSFIYIINIFLWSLYYSSLFALFFCTNTRHVQRFGVVPGRPFVLLLRLRLHRLLGL